MLSPASQAGTFAIPETGMTVNQPPPEPGRSRLFPQAAGLNAASAMRGRVRLRTLSNLRWLAIAGQSAALFLVNFGFGYSLPLVQCALAIALSAVLNIVLTLRYLASRRLSNRGATGFLAYDVLQLAALLYLTGGIQNPFALMFLAPVVIGASTLNLGNALILAGLAFVSVCTIAVWHQPLPWTNEGFTLPPLYQAGIWASLVLGIGFTSIYAWRIAREGARMSAGLAATQLALAREHRMASLGALATAAAHELGTPLGTIAVVARELERSLKKGTPESDDARLLREQAERCRAILTRLARPEEAMLEAAQRLPFGALLDDIAAPYRGEDVEITIDVAQQDKAGPQPRVWRAPELRHGLGNLIENAADFANARVHVELSWDAATIHVTVQDDGAGFAPEILERIGEPYTTSRPGRHALEEDELGTDAELGGHEGMGLGFFIAKTLIEQTGGSVIAGNVSQAGARVEVRWPRGAIDGETPPASPALDE